MNELSSEDFPECPETKIERVRIEAEDSIEFVCGKSSIRMDKYGNITISGTSININASDKVMINGVEVEHLAVEQPRIKASEIEQN